MKTKYSDGYKFGKLTIIKFSNTNWNDIDYYICLCECGGRIKVTDSRIRNDKDANCGCIKRKNKRHSNNLRVGTKFGKITIIKYSGQDGENETYLCQCKCGKLLLKKRLELNESLKDCGCVFLDKMSQDNGKKFNRLTIISFSHLESNKEFVTCRCDCGKICILDRREVKGYHLSGCGCLTKTKIKTQKEVNYVTINTLKARLMKSYRKTAKDREHSFNLSREEFYSFLPLNCHYCNTPPSNKRKYNELELKYSGLDRIDSSKGYSVDNCVPCCKVCNLAKRDMKLEDFLKWVSMVYKHSVDAKCID